MAVYDRWHKKTPDLGEDGEPLTCQHRRDDRPLHPSTDHGCAKRWQVRWRDPYAEPPADQRKRNFAKKDGKNPNVHSDAFDKKIQGEIASGSYIDPKAGEITLKEWSQEWRGGRTGKASTLSGLDDRLAHIEDSIIAGKSLRELSQQPILIQQWIKTLEDTGLKPGYLNTIITTLSTLFVMAIDNGRVGRNPVQSKTVTRPVVPPKLVVPWTAAQVQAAGENLGEAVPCLGAVPYLGAGAGLRQGEIFGCGVEDIKRAEGIIQIRRQVQMVDGALCFCLPKGDKIRDVPLSDVLDSRLLTQVEACPPVAVTLPWEKPGGKLVTVKLLMARENGLPFYRGSAFPTRWSAARAAAGVDPTPDNGVHVLRHTFASACLALGVDIRTLAEWLGHADPGFTLRIYGHLMPSAAARGRKAIDEFFKILG